MSGKRWTPEESEALAEMWGSKPIAKICEKLGRSRSAILDRVQRLGLGAYLDNGDYVALNQVANALYGCKNSGLAYLDWCERHGVPYHMKRVGSHSFRVIDLRDFWIWAERNRSFIDFTKLEPLILGREPAWVAEQRRHDAELNRLRRLDPWTPEEDDRLRHYIAEKRYTFAELARMMGRTEGAIERRIRTIGIEGRPLRVPAHAGKWTDADYQALADGIRRGVSYPAIAQQIGKGEKTVRSKAFQTYLTENADQIRAMLGGGKWGDGVPDPTVRVALSLTRTKTKTRRDLNALAAILRARINQLGYDPYFQRLQCQHWDDLKGCTMGATDCDSCTDFLRIRPQYCARCGGTFFERKENRFCAGCRRARQREGFRRHIRNAARE